MRYCARLRLTVWCPIPPEPSESSRVGFGQMAHDHYEAVEVIYDALKWVGDSSLVKEIVAGDRQPMAERLFDTLQRTGAVR